MWDLPDLERRQRPATQVLAAVANDWQLSGIYTGQSGDRYSIGYGYQSGGGNVNITGSPNYGGRVVINGDPGSGCSDNQYAAVQHRGVLRPAGRAASGSSPARTT